MSVAVAQRRRTRAMVLGDRGDDADDRRARPAALAAGRGLGAEVPRRGGRRPPRRCPRGSSTGCAARACVASAGGACCAAARAVGARAAAPRERAARAAAAAGARGPHRRGGRSCRSCSWSALLGFGGWQLVLLLRAVSLARWGVIAGSALLTLCARARLDRARHALGAAGRAGDRPLAAALARLPAGRPGRRLVPRADAVSRS